MAKDGNPNKDIDLKNYDDGGVSLREMGFGLWLSEKRRLLLKLLTIFLIAVSAFFFIFSTYQYVMYFLAGDPNDQSWLENMVASPRKVTDDLIISSPQTFVSGEKIDLAVKIANPNDNFMATFRYCFRQLETDIACDDGFIMPSEDKYVLALGQEGDRASAASFAISEIFWRRIDNRKTGVWEDYSHNRLNFALTDVQFAAGENSGLSEKINLNSLRFSVSNDTPYGYYEAPLDLLFFSGAQLVGVNRHLLTDFLSGQKREISLSWPGNLGGVTHTEIKPSINIMDDNVYLLYRGEENL